MSIVTDRLHVLEDAPLKAGAHPEGAGFCAMEMVAYIAGEDWTDQPACVSPVLAGFLRRWNDDLDDEGRQLLKPLLPRTIGTAGDGHDELRGWLCADWLVRVHTPAWLELAGIRASAQALRDLPPLRSLESLIAVRPALNTARERSDAAWDAAWAAARDAAWDAARAAARAAAWAAAGDAAWAAARDAAWDAARAAARAAAWAAAGDAAWDALRPTMVELQRSALELVELMIDPTRAAA